MGFAGGLTGSCTPPRPDSENARAQGHALPHRRRAFLRRLVRPDAGPGAAARHQPARDVPDFRRFSRHHHLAVQPVAAAAGGVGRRHAPALPRAGRSAHGRPVHPDARDRPQLRDAAGRALPRRPRGRSVPPPGILARRRAQRPQALLRHRPVRVRRHPRTRLLAALGPLVRHRDRPGVAARGRPSRASARPADLAFRAPRQPPPGPRTADLAARQPAGQEADPAADDGRRHPAFGHRAGLRVLPAGAVRGARARPRRRRNSGSPCTTSQGSPGRCCSAISGTASTESR